jgi:hypothetical protein
MGMLAGQDWRGIQEGRERARSVAQQSTPLPAQQHQPACPPGLPANPPPSPAALTHPPLLPLLMAASICTPSSSVAPWA